MINVTSPYLPNIKKYNKYLDRIYKDKWLTNNGPLVNELNGRLREYLGVNNLLLVSSGTMALNIAYKLLNVKKSVITTPFSFVATTSSLVWDNLDPVFCDINPKTFNIDAKNILSILDDSIDAILPVHVFGNSCDVESIQDIASKHKKKLIYDSSHAFGVNYKKKSILNWGDISTLSFHATKIFHTAEGGGMVIKDDSLFEEAERLINFGYKDNHISTPGINGKMSEFHAAIGLSVLDDIEFISERRQKLYEYYQKNLSEVCEFQLFNEHTTNNFSFMPIVLPSDKALLKVLKNLNSNNIYPKRYFYPTLDSLSFVNNKHQYKNSQDIASRVLCLPLYDSLPIQDVRKIIELIKNAF